MYKLPSQKEMNKFETSLKEVSKKSKTPGFMDEVAKLSLKLDGPIFGEILKAGQDRYFDVSTIRTALRHGEEQEGTEPICALDYAQTLVNTLLRKFGE